MPNTKASAAGRAMRALVDEERRIAGVRAYLAGLTPDEKRARMSAAHKALKRKRRKRARRKA